MNAVLNLSTDPDVINHLPLDQVATDPNQPRKKFDETYLQDLASDIAARGVLQPITVRPGNDGKAIIVYGECRYRASQLAGCETIPAITVYTDRDPVDRLIDQVAENLKRADLSPMEMAAFFDALHTEHKIKITEIPAVLEQRGLKKMERSYISNMRRLLNLPQWAKDMIDCGRLTPSHGKHILMAVGHDQVLADIQTGIEIDDEPITVSELAHVVRDAFGDNYRDITETWGKDGTRFDIDSCAGCKTRKTFKDEYDRTEIYCFDEHCWQQKQDQASDEAKENENQIDLVAECNRANADETAASHALTSDGAIALQKGRIERTQLYLDEWLRLQLDEHLGEDEANKYRILLWCAAGAPGNYSASSSWNHRLETPCHDLDSKHGIDLCLKDQTDMHELLDRIVKDAVKSMSRANLRRLAHHCEITLEDNYIVTAEYLAIKTKAEIIQATPIAVQDLFDDWSKTCKKPAGELIDAIINRDHAFGVPADLIDYYNGEV